MEPEPFVVVGRISKTHGLKGEVSVANAIEAPLHCLEGLEVWFVPPPRGRRTAVVTGVRNGPKGTLLTFEGITSIDDAQALVGCSILVHGDAVTELPVEHPEQDHIGYRVLDAVHGDLGTITEVIITGANDVWVVEGGFGEVLIPVIEDVVDLIDDGSRTVSVRLLPGLLPGEDDLA